jgi:2-C-methyl-D-erythritol 4-phosphate cytidylyltransferase
VWLRAAELFINRDDVIQTIIVIAPGDREWFQHKFQANLAFLGLDVVDGGEERADSVEAALARVNPQADFVAVHDAVRPCLVPPWIDTIFAEAEKSGAAIFALPVTETLKKSTPEHHIEQTLSRDGVWAAQTPQVFRRQLLLDAYAARGDRPATDDAALVESLGHPVRIVEGSPLNIKITSGTDMKLATCVLKVLPKPKVSGPAHPFAEDEMWGGRL